MKSDLEKFVQLSVEEIELDLDIKFSNQFEFEALLMTHPKKLARFHRWYSQAVKSVDDLQIKTKILEAELIQKEVESYQKKEGKSFPQSALQEVRKTRLFLYKEMQELQRELNEANEIKNYVSGLVDAWQTRGYRLQELGQLLLKRTGNLTVDDKLYKAGTNLNY